MSIHLGSQSVSVYLGTSAVTVPGVYIGGLQVFPTGPSVPGAPAIDGANSTNGSTGVVLFSGTDDGGSAITSYEFTFDGVPVVPDTADLSTLNFTFNANYQGQDVRARAVNAVGPGPYSQPLEVG